MAELEIVGGGSVAGPVKALGRWGILLLLPQWLGEQVAAGGRVEEWSDDGPLPLQLRRTEAPAAVPAQTIAPRAAGIALRRTIVAWRAAERDLATAAIGSRDLVRFQQEYDALREAHHRLFLEVCLSGRFGAAEAAP